MNMDIGFSAVKLFPKEALSKGKSKNGVYTHFLASKFQTQFI